MEDVEASCWVYICARYPRVPEGRYELQLCWIVCWNCLAASRRDLMMVLTKCVRTLTGLNSSLPVLLRQDSAVQLQGNPGLSTWHLMLS